MITIIFLSLSALAGIYFYVCIGFMILHFEQMVKRDADDKPYNTVYERLIWKVMLKMSSKDGTLLSIRKQPAFIKRNEQIKNMIVALWPCISVAEVINHYLSHKNHDEPSEKKNDIQKKQDEQ